MMPAANETTRDCQPLILSFLLSFLRNTHTHLFKLSSYTTNTANMVAQTAEFKKAVEDSRKLKAKPSDDELLQLYGLFKQGTQDPPIESSDKPGMFDLKGKAKRNAWQKLVDEGVSPSDAQKKYVALVESLKKKHGYTG
ncbi:hypothetical protein D6C90_03176 [Aureobasidium pullulans]|uniref:ACB domain-containing protein n=1 Tax=Aureobasidium pullulans TaxID=5580 RepID=A0A4S9NEU8_AURPU|nr:hypothetical protein D6C99_03817 [Aureobasidium pullulans]THY55286.1 hypothetical protein D6C97_05492 [Aureobasidium pullulans]THZ49776.1 hypothetical protein D6C90_03176 [Aureobasidium pullulans]